MGVIIHIERISGHIDDDDDRGFRELKFKVSNSRRFSY